VVEMSKKVERKRMIALKNDPLGYRREVPEGAMEVHEIRDAPHEEHLILVGRIMLADNAGKISRFGLFDIFQATKVIVLENIEGNGLSIPAYLTRTSKNIQAVNSVVHHGDVVMLRGKKLRAENGDVFLADEIALISKAVADVYDSNINFQKRANLYAHRHLQLMREPQRISFFLKLSRALRIIREFLYREGYDELNLTLLQDSFEAGLANPFVTHVVERNEDMYLRLTSELFLRKLMIAGFSKVFEIGKSFRNQGVTGNMLPQFTILELYSAYADREEIENLLRNMICEILADLYGSMSIPAEGGDIDCSTKWQIFDFKDEIEKKTGSVYDEQCSIGDFVLLLDKANIPRPPELNKYTIATALYSHVVSKIRGPAFLRNLPAAQSPLFKLNDDGSTVDETLLVIDGMLVADIVNPERDPEVLRKRLEEQIEYRKNGQDSGINEDILHAMKFGLPPCRGIGMGLERLFALLLNVKDTRDIELFPVF
jgi:lysyl-tRNA synthetase class 2